MLAAASKAAPALFIPCPDTRPPATAPNGRPLQISKHTNPAGFYDWQTLTATARERLRRLVLQLLINPINPWFTGCDGAPDRALCRGLAPLSLRPNVCGEPGSERCYRTACP